MLYADLHGLRIDLASGGFDPQRRLRSMSGLCARSQEPGSQGTCLLDGYGSSSDLAARSSGASCQVTTIPCSHTARRRPSRMPSRLAPTDSLSLTFLLRRLFHSARSAGLTGAQSAVRAAERFIDITQRLLHSFDCSFDLVGTYQVLVIHCGHIHLCCLQGTYSLVCVVQSS